MMKKLLIFSLLPLILYGCNQKSKTNNVVNSDEAEIFNIAFDAMVTARPTVDQVRFPPPTHLSKKEKEEFDRDAKQMEAHDDSVQKRRDTAVLFAYIVDHFMSFHKVGDIRASIPAADLKTIHSLADSVKYIAHHLSVINKPGKFDISYLKKRARFRYVLIAGSEQPKRSEFDGGRINFSRVQFNPQKTMACVDMDYTAGRLDGGGMTLYFIKSGNHWKLIYTDTRWVS
jgi:hypothetical protein